MRAKVRTVREATVSELRAPTSGLVERSAELDALDDAIERAAGGEGAVVLLEAASGLGKTELLDHAAEIAAQRGFTVRRAAPGPFERQVRYGTIHDLFERPLLDLDPVKPVRLLEPGDTGPMVAHGILWNSSKLTEHLPLALIVDDAQWADRSSLEVLAYVARRIDHLPVVLILGARAGEPDAPTDLLGMIAGGPAGIALRPAPLTTAGATQLIRRFVPDASVDLCYRCRLAAGGNPWLLLELARQVASLGPEVLDANDADWPVSDSARAAVRRRLAALTPSSRAVAYAVAVLGEHAAVHLAGQIADVSIADVAHARDALAGAGLLAEGQLRLTHPLVAAAVLEDLAPAQRGRLHRDAARVLLAESAPIDLVASHLVRTDPEADGEISALLGWAAVEAAESGMPGAAVTYLERALDERAAGDDRSAMLARLATAAFDAGEADSGPRLREALREARDSASQVDVLTRLAALGVLRPGDGVITDVSEDGGPAAQAAALDALLMLPDRRHERARRVAELAGGSDAELALVALAHRAWLATELGTPDAAEPAGAAVRDDRLLETAGHRAAYHLAIRALVMSDRFGEAAAAVARLRAYAARRGSLRLRAAAEWYDAERALHLGRVADAEGHARVALALVDERTTVTRGALAVLVSALAERGSFDEARALLADAGGLLHARARLSLAEGDYELAHARAVEAGAARVRNPALTPWRSTAALALAHQGRLDDAAALADEELTLATRFGAPLAIAVALHARSVAEPHVARRIGLAERGLDVVAAYGATGVGVRLAVELGHAVASTGERLEAREALRRALADADALGLTLLAERARRELVATGMRPRKAALDGVESLTPRQRQVSDLAAAGRANRAIAHELFLSIKTVETHLAAAYGKLGVNTRAALGLALASSTA